MEKNLRIFPWFSKLKINVKLHALKSHMEAYVLDSECTISLRLFRNCSYVKCLC